MNALSLKGRTALVTGSSSGIGLGIARAFQGAGARVLFHSHQPAPIEDCLVADLTAPEAPAALIEAAFDRAPGLDLLVSNAGSFFDVPFLEMTPDRWEKTIALNLRSGYFLIQAFARRLVREGRKGSVLVTASTNGFLAEPDSSAYDISKGALVMLTRTLALSLAPHGIRVNAIAPGLIETPLSAAWLQSRPGVRERSEERIPLRRLGTPEDCAPAAVFLCSDAAAYLTGEILVIDGGLTIQQVGQL
jgi:NAD(P)-dependent dehydrogenase (short-subunit alcohol dehydrogenase family)